MNSFKQPYIIDTDCGIDDAQCIMTSLYHLNVVALTTVAGNSPLDKVVSNTAKVLEVCGEKRPIYIGCKVPIIMGVEVESIHG
jgi:inosine-uridine nucleoside N-ribohydrolase